MTDIKKPKVASSTEKELDRVEKQFEAYEDQIKEMTFDQLNKTPKEEVEPQTRLSQKEIEKSPDIRLKPKKIIACRDRFNENYRKEYEESCEYVHFIAENHEVIGETIDLWTRPFAGMPAEEWEVPCNKPVWGPRYLAEQIKRKYYHRLVMTQATTNRDQNATYYGQMVVDTTIPRLDARPASGNSKSIFMGK